MKFLLVEDDPSHSLLIREKLTEFGAEVVAATTVAGAIRLLDAEPGFDLAVLDRDLPDGSGLEVQDFLSKRSNAPPVLFVTSDDSAEHAVRAMKGGALGYVVKRPEYLGELIKEVASAIGTLDNAPPGPPSGNRSEYEERERSMLSDALERHRWNVSATARALGIGRGKLRGRMSVLALDE